MSLTDRAKRTIANTDLWVNHWLDHRSIAEGVESPASRTAGVRGQSGA